MARELKDGEQIRLKGTGGALFLVTVGDVFSKSLIEKRLASGEWSWPGTDPKPVKAKADKPTPVAQPEPAPTVSEGKAEQAEPSDPDRPAANAPKSEWVQYAARTQHMSLEDAANYTKADLIDMVS
ncbi:hypothetical protein PV708_04730 [Streptomyces sp. ME02-6977A]|uniref:hypothetical protein n=1 Tax=Streptomyces sp. ME02-6977A TaxID=3028671 RepID=UPI0029ABA51C|nr:hypothetical protein [Streptomyces sp. ME02-6977A]MDX3405530.1 hypothetical protein [Streptomyces sp. ME02-6977A]